MILKNLDVEFMSHYMIDYVMELEEIGSEEMYFKLSKENC